MAEQWYDKPMRIAALQCQFDGYEPLAVLDGWLERGFNVEQLFHPMASGYTAVYDDAAHGPLVRRYIARAKASGMRIILYVNVHILPPEQADKAELWGRRRADGGFHTAYDTYYCPCLNGPWTDRFMEVLDAVCRLDVDGVFLDGPIANECCCEHCRRRHREWFGPAAVFGENPAAFYGRTRGEFLRRSYRRFKAGKPDALFYVNQAVRNLEGEGQSLAEALEYNDILGTEGGFMFYDPPKAAELWKPSQAAKLLEAVAPGKPRVVFTAADQKPWSWQMHTAVETELVMASTVANGANIWYGLHGGVELLNTPGGRAASEFMGFLREHEDVYTATVSEARVAVMYSHATERFYRCEAGASDLYGQAGAEIQGVPGNLTEAFGGVFDALSRGGVAFDVISDHELTAGTLARYELVILPTAAGLSDACVAMIRRYVEGGGNLLASGDTSLRTPDGRLRGDFALADVFGASFEGRCTSYARHNYIRPAVRDDLTAGWDAPLIPAPAVGIDIAARGGASVLANYHQPLAGRYVPLTPLGRPAIVLNRFGRGRCLYLAGTFAEMIQTFNPPPYSRLIRAAAEQWTHGPARLTGGLGNVEMTVRRRGDRRIVHLVNYAGIGPRPFEAVAGQRGLELLLPAADGWAAARALRSGSTCPLTARGEHTIVVLPELDTYEVVVMER
ncbi:MAG: hypothetical protein GX591_05205 [Planctomycetes bacterium]|nr:hypothetical protein [Planctomycetota bacterium]